MWINKRLFEMVVADNKEQAGHIANLRACNGELAGRNMALSTQKTKDDLSIDWMRHRVNALEKQNAILIGKAAGVAFPVPEIVPTRPGSLSPLPNFDSMPSFEDVGDEEAKRLGLDHDPLGFINFKADHQLSQSE